MNVCLCDDDKIWQEECKSILFDFAEKHGVEIRFRAFDSGEQFLFSCEDIAPSIDILLMDINMPGVNGLDAVTKLSAHGFTGVVIFLTVSGENYADAFDRHAFNYIEKKDMGARFEKVMALAVSKVNRNNEDVITISCAGVTENIALASISYFEVNRAVITVHYDADKTMEFYTTMDKIEERLFGKGFIRVHRAFLVNSVKIRSVRYGEVTLKDGAVIPVSRSKMDEVKAAMASLR